MLGLTPPSIASDTLMKTLECGLGLSWFACFGITALTGSFLPLILWGASFVGYLALRGRKIR